MADCSAATTRIYRRGDPGFIAPGTHEHSRVITASKVPSILNVSRWESSYSLWHRIRGDLKPKPVQDIFNVGLAMEHALAELWKMENPGWKLSRGEVQFVTDRWEFPAMATCDRRANRGRSRRILEMKCARSLEEWGDPTLTGEIPTDYSAQVLFQMMVSGITNDADVLLMGPWFNHRTYHVAYDEVVVDWIVRECERFWDSLVTGVEPSLDDSLSTYACVRELHPDIDGSVVDVPEELITQIHDLRDEIGPLESKQRGLKTQLLDLMGSAQKAYVNGEVVARRQPHRAGGVTLVVT